jgi:anion transporter
VERTSRRDRWNAGKIIAATVGLLGLAVGIAAPFDFLPAPAQASLGLIVFAVLFWSSTALPLELTSLLLLLAMPALGLLAFDESFAPFAQKTLWLLFAGMVISQAITYSGTDEYLAWRCFRSFNRSPFRLLVGLHLLGLFMSFVVPSGMVRVLILIPLGIKLAEHLGGDEDRALTPGILAALVCSTYYGGCGVLTGSVPNIVVAAQLEQYADRSLLWTEWLRWMFPVIGFLRIGICLAVVWLIWGRKIRRFAVPKTSRLEVGGQLNPRMAFVLSAGVLLWLTDSYHHLAPTYVGLLMVAFLLTPRIGLLPVAELRHINFPFFFYFAALISLGTALEKSGFNAEFARHVTANIELGELGWFGRHLAITCIVVPLDFLMDIAAVAGMITPTMLEIGHSTGMAELPVAMSVAMATTLVFLPYQAAPFMIAVGHRQLPAANMILAMTLISTVSLIVLCPLNLIYWHWLGFI